MKKIKRKKKNVLDIFNFFFRGRIPHDLRCAKKPLSLRFACVTFLITASRIKQYIRISIYIYISGCKKTWTKNKHNKNDNNTRPFFVFVIFTRLYIRAQKT